MRFSAALLQNACLLFKVKANKCKADGEVSSAPLRDNSSSCWHTQQVTAWAETLMSSHTFWAGGQGQTSYLLCLFVHNNLGMKKWKALSEMNFDYSIPKEETNKFCFQAQTVCLVPAQPTIFKETSWSESFNEFSTPYHIPWICIIWTIFLEVIFQSVAQHFICTNASAWVIHTSKMWMYKRGPGILNKKVWQFPSVSSALSGEGQFIICSGENDTTVSILPWDKDCLGLQSAVPCRAGRLGAAALPCAVQRDALGPCAMNAAHWLVWWNHG